MILWLVLTIMISVAAVLVSAPFIRRYERSKIVAEADLAVYRDQLREVDHEASTGMIDATQADAARTEIKRRMLAAPPETDQDMPGLSGGERAFAAIAVAAVVVFGSVGLFALTADLEPSASSPSARAASAPLAASDKPAVKSTDTDGTTTTPAPGVSATAQAKLPPVDELIQRILVRVQRNPKDLQGWRLLGWSYYSTDQFSEAAEAYARAIELDPNSTELRGGRTEALIRAAKGMVTPEARVAIEETLKINPKDPRGRYLEGLALEQAGDKAGAQRNWSELLSELDPNDPWAKELRQKIATGRMDGTDGPGTDKATSAVIAPSPRPESSNAKDTNSDRRPTPEDIRAAEAMTPSDRSAMIRRMVDSLAERLDRSPNDADGWLKLIRSLSVLGEQEKAKQALDKALKTFAEDSSQIKRITAAAEELGLPR